MPQRDPYKQTDPLPIFEAEFPGDERPAEAIAAARAFARGEIDAAWAARAAWAASAARAAEWEWQTRLLLDYAHGRKT